MDSNCLDCGQGFHEDCLQAVDGKCCCDGKSDGEDNRKSSGMRDGLKWAKDDSDIRDIKSTGRKRAARNYPLDRSASCEWVGLLYAGGGIRPIIGCVDGTQDHRHHSPIYLTTANVEGNVHRICSPCHRVYHVLNDPYVKDFVQTVVWRPHDEETRAPVELLQLASASEKMRINLSAERYDPKTYKKDRDDYTPLLDTLQASGEVVNPWLGI